MSSPTVIWAGNPFFQSALADLGWRVHFLNPAHDAVLTWDDLVTDAGFIPDVVVAADKSTPPFVTGMEKFPCLTAFYSVDSHIHSWHPHYAQAFDIRLVSLRGHLPLFADAGRAADTVWWSPPYAKPQDIPRPPDPAKPLRDVLFVGNVNKSVNPERHVFFEALAPLVPGLRVERGAYRDLYPQANIVLNHAISGDLNFRVFEALGCGACLVTPFVRHGLEDLFQNGRDLFIYDQNDIPALAALLRTLLKHPERRKTVAAQGHDTVAAAHYMRHRAETFAANVTTLLTTGQARAMIDARLANARHIHESRLRFLYLLHADTVDDHSLKAAYLKAAKP